MSGDTDTLAVPTPSVARSGSAASEDHRADAPQVGLRRATTSPADLALALAGRDADTRPGAPRDAATRERDAEAYARALRSSAPVNAAAYLQSFQRSALHQMGEYLRTRPITTGHPDLDFVARSPLPFLDRLGRMLDVGDSRDLVLRLQACLAPTDLLAVVDRNRPLTDTRRSYAELMAEAGGVPFDDGNPYDDGPQGPRVWVPAVGIAIGAELEARLTESLARMAARYVAVAARKRQTALAAGTMPASVEAGELVPAHPLDWYVARAFAEEPATVEPSGGTLHADPRADVDYHRVREVEWLPPPSPWNAVRPVRPAKASREAMAARLLGAPTEAHRLTQVGDYFVVPEELAARFPEATKHRPAVTGTSTDAVLSLATGTRAAEVAAAEAPAPTAAVRHGELESLWTQVDERLRGLALVTGKLTGHGSSQQPWRRTKPRARSSSCWTMQRPRAAPKACGCSLAC